MGVASLAVDEAAQAEGASRGGLLAQARRRAAVFERSREEMDAGRLPGFAVDLVVGDGIEGRGVDRSHPEGPDGDAVHDAVVPRPGRSGASGSSRIDSISGWSGT